MNENTTQEPMSQWDVIVATGGHWYLLAIGLTIAVMLVWLVWVEDVAPRLRDRRRWNVDPYRNRYR